MPGPRRGQTPAEIDEARVRVGHLLERAIDGKQIAMSTKWEFYNKVASFTVSGIVTVIAFTSFFELRSYESEDRRWLTAAVLPLSIVAGFIAPVAKDLVTALEKLGKK